ncbi:hypothetical protein BGW36DRAFT_55575 [Talaromyces proteolyticus]|uniref:SnoaL-like domain-containing protein n=1 Tax=Talaromyces proteolyticus TaxID=1131652 RepID=A0AAD4KMZ4_9EURO|nr:uncharacterized protein BGW36DRAFT_55575 [Talaromyces proteolyticus]KAH8691650.1 hypothetical protein BGW36DRAFT_55575 [Talaromyces proteolyticus]
MEGKKHTPRSILGAFYDAERVYMSAPVDKRDFSGISATLSPDVKLEQTPNLPYGGVYTGAAGFQQWSGKMAELFDAVDVKEPEIFEREGSNRIVVLSTVNFRVRKTGKMLVYPFCQVVSVDLEKGQITEMRPFYWNVHALNEALGFSH